MSIYKSTSKFFACILASLMITSLALPTYAEDDDTTTSEITTINETVTDDTGDITAEATDLVTGSVNKTDDSEPVTTGDATKADENAATTSSKISKIIGIIVAIIFPVVSIALIILWIPKKNTKHTKKKK